MREHDRVVVIRGLYAHCRGTICGFTRGGGLLVDLGEDTDTVCVMEFDAHELELA